MLVRDSANRALAAAWRRRLLPEPLLEREAIEAAALRGERRAEAAREHAFQVPLGPLLTSLRDEAALSPLGRTMAWGQLVRILRQRLRAYDLWARHPGILARPVGAPVVVLGHMRSGTTRLHRLLACDPRFSHSRFWEVMNPVPGRGRDWRRAEAWFLLKLLRALNPELQAIHPMSLDAPEEEFGLFSFSLHGAQLEAQWRIPGFAALAAAADRRPAYAEFRRLLQTIEWARGERPGRPRLLKAPQFMEDLAAFLDVFPGARLICLERDPCEVVASSASLVWNQMRIQSERADKGWIGAAWLAKTAHREMISRQVRAARADIPRIEVEFEAMNWDWRAEMRRIYAFLELELTPQVERRMQLYVVDAEKSGFGRHSYSLEEFGLDRDTVERTIGAARAQSI